MRFHSPQWVALGATLVVVGGSATAGYLHWRDDSEPPPPTAAPIQPGMGEAGAVADALRKLASKPQSLVATDVQSAVGGDARNAVPKGARVTPAENSWHPDGLGGGTMTVSVAAAGKPAATYSAIMIKERTGWKVLGTVPMYPTSAAAPMPAQPAAVAPAGTAPAGAAPAGTAPAGTTPGVQPGPVQPRAGQPGAQAPGARPAAQGTDR